MRVGSDLRASRVSWRVTLAFMLLMLSCKGGAEETHPSQADKPKEIPKAAQPIYDGALKPGWNDLGWADKADKETPGKLFLNNGGGWILQNPQVKGPIGGVRFRYKAPPAFGDFLEVRLDSSSSVTFPRVQVSDRYRYDGTDGWVDVYIPVEELNPRVLPFDRVVFRAVKQVPREAVEIDKLAFTVADLKKVAALEAGGGRSGTVARSAKLSIDCAAPSHPINPLIYGIAFDGLHETKHAYVWELGATARRWGGNPTTRYNWKLGNAWNTANDYYFRNVGITDDPKYSYDKFLETNLAHKTQTALTVPMIGWVAKDKTSVGFPVSKFGPQQQMDPENAEAGNGVSITGKTLSPGKPTATSVEAPPEFIGQWVKEIQDKDKKRGRSVQMYILDNEPMLWSTTHRDVHPDPTSYDELLDRTIKYGTAVRKADPDAVIAGPAEWGWTNFFWSSADFSIGSIGHPDRRAHGDVPLLAWYLRKLREYEQKSGVRVLDVVDVHFYPAASVGIAEQGETDPVTSARRIRSTRALWDPTYTEEAPSWIKDKVQLIPRLKGWIAENYPGRGISIGEYNFGASKHMSGGLAQAEALGRFAQEGITSAFYFQYPPDKSPTFWAFRAYRDFDGKGGRFLDTWVPATAPAGTSLFASRDESGTHVVAIALNLDQDAARDAHIELNGCGKVSSARVLGYSGEPTGFSERPPKAAGGKMLDATLPPYSITVFDLQLER